jgi:gamma-glutamylcyclotransferase (GGCT)/AIG2-like uncharacterized protein YtfP
MQHSINKLFVYGSLRSGFRNPAYDYITRYFDLIGEAVVRGRLFDAGDHPVAVADPGDHFITGELYELKDPSMFEWAFEQLDDYEGIYTEPGVKPLYKRETADIYKDGKPHPAWLYWYNGNVEGMPALEMGDVLKFLQEKNKPR